MHGRQLVWLGLTPEPERDLPGAVALLRSRRVPVAAPAADPSSDPDADLAADLAALIGAERSRVEALILRGTQRSWMRYLAEVTALVTEAAASAQADGDLDATRDAAETVLEHHRMLIGLPGTAYDRAADDREALSGLVASLRTRATERNP